MQEDHVSMAWASVRKLRKLIDNLRRILAVEYVIGARAVDLRAPLQPAPATAAAITVLRTVVAGVGPDRYLAPELAAAEEILRSDTPAAAMAAQGVILD